MARILVAWELGGGGGHVEIVLPVIERLLADGHDVSIAARDVVAASGRLGGLPVRLLPAPYFSGNSQLPQACSYAEMLMRVGYADPAVVSALLSGWLGLVELTRCDSLVVEHAPGALLAARVAGVPAVVLGTGFTLPPAGEPMPAMALPQAPPVDRLRHGEGVVVAAMNRALAGHGASPLECLARLFDCHRTFLCSFAEMDHYGVRAGVKYWGAVVRLGRAAEPVWPTGRGERIFVYMHPGYGHFRSLLEQLSGLGQPTLVVAPGIPDKALDDAPRGNIKVVNRAVDLARVAACCRVVITHGGHGILASLLGLGVPPILAPAYVEQSVMAMRLAGAGMALLAGADPSSYRYAPLVEQLPGDSQTWRRAADFARRHPLSGAAQRNLALQSEVVAALFG